MHRTSRYLITSLATLVVLALVMTITSFLSESLPLTALPQAAPAVTGPEVLAKWPGPQVTYTLVNCPVSLDCAIAHQALRDALNTWDRAMELDLVEVASGGEIQIRWATGAITSSTAFDGKGGILAYGVPPYSWSPLSGDLIFDDAERWVVDQPYYAYPVTIDLRNVALHESGHALGLNHIDDPNSIMYPHYQPGKGLSSADVALIQRVYGAETGQSAAAASAPASLPTTAFARTTTSVNLREGPSRTAAALALIPQDTEISVLAWGATYTQVQYGSVQGWVATQYITPVTH